MAFADETLSELLEQLAARTPAPGGGAGAAIAGATAAALAEMAAAFAAARPGGDPNMENARNRAALLRARLLELADEDARSYQPVLDALARARADPDRAGALEAALSDAADPPLKIAIAAAEVAELAAAAATAPGNEHLLGDATAAATIADAATQAAARLVALNLARVPDDLRLKQADELVQRAGEARTATVRLRA